MNAYRSSADLPSLRRRKAAAGRWLEKRRPELAARVARDPFRADHGPAARLIRNALQARAVDERDHDLLERFLRNYWSSETADEFFEHFSHRFETLFLRHHLGVVEELDRRLDASGHGLSRLVELGSGDGQALEYLRMRLPQLEEFVGLDLNRVQVEACAERCADPPELRFEHVGDEDWLRRNPRPGTILFTNGGVLEYMTRRRVRSLLDALRAGGPCVAAFTETLALDHELERDDASHPYGHELAFSHNYPAILREAGFEVKHVNDRFTEPGEEHHPNRWFQVVAAGGVAPALPAHPPPDPNHP